MQEYEEEHSKLVSVVTSMEQNIKVLLKDFDSKKKVNITCVKLDPNLMTLSNIPADFAGQPPHGDGEKAVCLFLHKPWEAETGCV